LQETVPQILVVDDDTDIGTMLKMMLEYKEYAVTVCERADQMDEAIHSQPFDLIIMDMLLSGINGVDICRSLRAINKLSKMPIMMYSAHPNAKDLCMQAGADDFISKPFDMNEILEKISLLIQKKNKT
jgi:DNA-binding response OmpR family regulator